MESLFSVVFYDNSVYKGGDDYFNTKWTEIPLNKKIRSLFIRLSSGDNLVLSGYDRYFYRIEACKDLMGKRAGELRIEYIFIYAQKEDLVKIYKIDLRNKNEVIDACIVKSNDKEITRLNSLNWR